MTPPFSFALARDFGRVEGLNPPQPERAYGRPFVATRHCRSIGIDFPPVELPSPLAQLAAACRIEKCIGEAVAALV